MTREELRKLVTIANECGFIHVEQTNKSHLAFRDGRGNVVHCSRSTGDNRAFKNSAALLRRYARQSGILGSVSLSVHEDQSPVEEKVIPMPEPTKPIEVREPTHDQRFKIRQMLDRSFDDAVGMYLDGTDDQKIAEAVGVPRIIVERMREAAYGPIKITAEQAAAKVEIAKIREEMARIATRLNDLEKMFNGGAPMRKSA